MVDILRRAEAVRDPAAVGARTRAPGRFAAFFRSLNIWFWAIVGLPTLLAGVYFFAIASDLYLSEVKFLVRGPTKTPSNAISAMFSSAAVASVTEDTHAVHEYLLSRDAVRRLERENDLRILLGAPGRRSDQPLSGADVLAPGFRIALCRLFAVRVGRDRQHERRQHAARQGLPARGRAAHRAGAAPVQRAAGEHVERTRPARCGRRVPARSRQRSNSGSPRSRPSSLPIASRKRCLIRRAHRRGRSICWRR